MSVSDDDVPNQETAPVSDEEQDTIEPPSLSPSDTQQPTNTNVGSSPKDVDEDVFGAGSDSDSDVGVLAAIKAVTNEGDQNSDIGSEHSEGTPVKRKARLLSDSDLEEEGEKLPTETGQDSPPRTKKARVEDDESENEGEQSGDEESELQTEVDDLAGEIVAELGSEEVVGGDPGTESDDEPEDQGGASGMSDWDIMMAKRKEAMARARRKKRDGGVDLANDEQIVAMISQMKMAAEDDRHLNMERKAATKKLQMLPTVVAHLKKVDLVDAFLEYGVLAALSDWISPLPDHSLPHLKIRENVLDLLKSFPIPDAVRLKHSKIGKAVMLLYRHPKETRKNREKAGKIVNEWARPIFGLASDFKSLSRVEREQRDYDHLSQSKKKRLSSSGERRPSQDEDFEPQKPGDKGWVGRARVPMPSTNDYMVRPKWNVEQKLPKKSSKKVLNRYEKQLQKDKQRKMQHKSTHAVSISVEGRNMPL